MWQNLLNPLDLEIKSYFIYGEKKSLTCYLLSNLNWLGMIQLKWKHCSE